MEQTRALNALEPFLALAKSANSPRAAADLIAQATAAPNTYVFAELLQCPTIQALRDSPEHAAHLRLLEIFAWGTWADYQADQTSLPPLSLIQTQKLKLLSLLPLASSPANLTYPSLTAALSLPTTQELESLLITALYNNLVTGTLDPSAERVHLTSVAPLRDIAPGAVPGLKTELGAWGERCDDELKDLETRIEAVRMEARKREARRRREELLRQGVEREFNVEAEKAADKQGGQSGMRGDEEMDLDEDGGVLVAGRGARGNKRGGGNVLGRR
ncbi:hypothetical protein K490DRAFT_33190 [Saccharata proteae CBS 121410]|uniref:PCI domain-containing protein n=1 Tax=Saccharata proteae CBS 121410 TaxID=1314787 RepID=A0A9P4M1I6_9PEZI|nr:hypothetical protein K490DRAFT_33190 [Saccharata proteae CBS 121410]